MPLLTLAQARVARMYPPGNLHGGVHPEHYIHCDGIQLKLADSNFGQEQYQDSDYYVWGSRSSEDSVLLFIFPTLASTVAISIPVPYFLCAQVKLFLVATILGSVFVTHPGTRQPMIIIIMDGIIFLQHLLILVKCIHQGMPIEMPL